MPLMSQSAQQRASQPTTQPIPLGAPLGGWNTRDPIQAMEATDAIVMNNWYPDIAGVTVRKGNAIFCNTTTGAPVYSLLAYQSGDQANLIAASGGSLWDVTTQNPVELMAGYASDKWQSTNFQGHMFLANGVDDLQDYNGTTIAASGFTGTDISQFVDCGTFHNRVYLWKKNESGFWYGGTDDISGALSFFDFSQIINDGGNLITVQPFSYDGGQGISSYTVFVFDTGTMLLYSGTDPSNASNWSLVGIYTIGVPLSHRAFARSGGDIYLTTFQDHLKLSVIITSLAQGVQVPLSKVSGAVSTAANSGSSLFGWDAVYFANGRRVIFNVPQTDGTFVQHVLNTTTNAWCQFSGLNGLCWQIFKGSVYWGAANGVVYQGGVGSVDILSETMPAWDVNPWDVTPWAIPISNSIQASAQQAWTTLDAVQNKRVALARPVMSSLGNTNTQFGVGFDYQMSLLPTATVQANASSPWDISPWDTTPWGDQSTTTNDWRVVGGYGSALSVSLNVNAIQPISWIRTDLRLEQGTQL